MKKIFFFLIFKLIFFIFLQNIFSNNTNYKITYFNLINNEVPEDYKFLSHSLPLSIKILLNRIGFSEVDKGSAVINDFKNRLEVLETGKKLSTDLILCGSYSIEGEGADAKIRLIIYIYDIKGEDLVIEKSIIGATDRGIFTMVDEAGTIIKNAVLDYYKRRDEILALAKKQREERERLEREQLEKEKVRIRYNNSMYMDTHVAPAKSIKIFFYTLYECNKYDVISYPSAGGEFISNINNKGIISDLFLSIGLGKNLELKFEIPINIYTRFEDNSLTGPIKKYFVFFNPVLGFKWRFLQNENHGLNFTAFLGFQPGLAEKTYSGSIFNAMNFTSAHAVHASIFIDKVMGSFTPFLSFNFIYFRRFAGINNNSYHPNDEKLGDIDSSKKNFFSFNLSGGFDLQLSSWFIIHPFFTYAYYGKIYANVLRASGIELSTIYPHYYLAPGMKIIFSLGKTTVLSGVFSYQFFKDIKWDAVGVSSSMVGVSKVKYSFKIFMVIASAIDF